MELFSPFMGGIYVAPNGALVQFRLTVLQIFRPYGTAAGLPLHDHLIRASFNLPRSSHDKTQTEG